MCVAPDPDPQVAAIVLLIRNIGDLDIDEFHCLHLSVMRIMKMSLRTNVKMPEREELLLIIIIHKIQRRAQELSSSSLFCADLHDSPFKSLSIT